MGETGEGGARYANDGCDWENAADELGLGLTLVLRPGALSLSRLFGRLASESSFLQAALSLLVLLALLALRLLPPLVLGRRSAKRNEGSLEEL